MTTRTRHRHISSHGRCRHDLYHLRQLPSPRGHRDEETIFPPLPFQGRHDGQQYEHVHADGVRAGAPKGAGGLRKRRFSECTLAQRHGEKAPRKLARRGAGRLQQAQQPGAAAHRAEPAEYGGARSVEHGSGEQGERDARAAPERRPAVAVSDEYGERDSKRLAEYDGADAEQPRQSRRAEFVRHDVGDERHLEERGGHSRAAVPEQHPDGRRPRE